MTINSIVGRIHIRTGKAQGIWQKMGLVVMPTTTGIMASFCFLHSLACTLWTFVWTCGRKESNSTWYAFHTWHAKN